jgi:hypothetical protein
MEIQLTLPQMRCLATLAKAAHGEQCFMGGGKRVHVLSACRALVRRGLAIEFNNVYFIASAVGRAEFARRNNSQPTLVDSKTESPPIFDSIIALNKELAKPEQDAIDAYRKIIKLLAELVTLPQTDEQFDDELLSRNAVMEKVTSIRYHAYVLFKSAHPGIIGDKS